MGDLVWVILSTKHLLALKSICHLCCHCVRVSRSSWSLLASSDPATVLYKMQSSANKRTFDVKFSGKSLIKIRNNNGPVTVPWGTLESTLTQSENSPLITTRCFLFVRKVLIQLRVLPLMPYLFSLMSNRLCGTLSKAFAKSIIIMSVCFLLSRSAATSWMVPINWVSHALSFMHCYKF